MSRKSWLIISMVVLLSACRPTPPPETFLVALVADGRERTFQLTESMTVEEFLKQTDVNVTVGDTDRLTPPRFTQLSDGMRITIVRVEEASDCEHEDIPYQRETVFNEGLAPGEERLAQVGKNGVQEVCYRTVIEDGVPGQRTRVGTPTLIEAPTNEVVIVGLATNPEPVPVTGTLTYINNNNAWVIKGNSTTKRPLTRTSNLDGLVMNLSTDGHYLLYTADPVDQDQFINELWLIETSENASPIKLVPTDVLYAEWMPNQTDTISYSTGEVQQIFPFWDALNNVWLMRIDTTTGQSLNIDQVLDELSGGLSGWWGTIFKWSPDGTTLAWARADSAGVIGEDGEYVPLVEYPLFRTSQPWSWRASLSWSWDAQLIATAAHGAPLGSEPPETSPVFNVVIADKTGKFSAEVVDSAGMWTAPRFSPKRSEPDSQYEYGYLAYLRSREPYNSINGEYDLVVADRDGSNAHVVFPPTGQPGITTQITGLTTEDFTWSPDGHQLAVIYQGNLWIVDVETNVTHQLTFDGQSKFPAWEA